MFIYSVRNASRTNLHFLLSLSVVLDKATWSFFHGTQFYKGKIPKFPCYLNLVLLHTLSI
ncbi:hypothetical protein Lalb_Chr06g0165341 [Lupinus albus]|uniref:Uncharacterized protein n=1 Tax=Lupinus albus TaxID=3870 RepID=A0A6A4QCI4_LUPAL|nr:hypothetical protein Lalb_Chr06g0165341 [Lupinus albus]